jgi:hypothetical protein
MNRFDLFDQALRLTHGMLENAESNDWQTVIALEARRRTMLEQAFATREPLSEELAARVREILDLDKGLLEISTRLRDQLGGELNQLNKANRASQAYRAHTA